MPFDLKQMQTVERDAERRRFSYRRAHGGGHQSRRWARRAPMPSTAGAWRLCRRPDEDLAALLDTVEAVEVEVYPRARVVVNERTGTVVIGGTVRLQPVSILHGGLSVNVISQPRSRSLARFRTERRRWCSRPRCRPRTSR